MPFIVPCRKGHGPIVVRGLWAYCARCNTPLYKVTPKPLTS